MAKDHYNWVPGEYARDTRHLSMRQHGAYRLLIDLYMDKGPLRNDLEFLCRWVGAQSIEERNAVKFVLAEFFVQDEGKFRHKQATFGAYHA